MMICIINKYLIRVFEFLLYVDYLFCVRLSQGSWRCIGTPKEGAEIKDAEKRRGVEWKEREIGIKKGVGRGGQHGIDASRVKRIRASI